ncbi:MAG: hypothetical protein H6982_15140 [Chromatiales bacterium]|nr:hypothetical protein [Chromatiales bacterium]
MTEQPRIDDAELVAYVDGELPPAERARIAEAIERDAGVAARARTLRDSATLLRGLFDAPMREPLPERLLVAATAGRGGVGGVDLAAVDSGPTVVPGGVAEAGGPSAEASDNVVEFPSRRQRRWWQPMALAASVTLGIGLAAGYLAGGGSTSPTGTVVASAASDTLAGLIAASDAAVRDVLDTTPSGTPVTLPAGAPGAGEVMPVLSFRDGAGRICRQYQQRIGSETLQASLGGVMCHTDAGWQLAALSVDEVRPTTSAGPSGTYTPASGGSGSSADAVVERMISGAALDASAERALIAAQWRAR